MTRFPASVVPPGNVTVQFATATVGFAGDAAVGTRPAAMYAATRDCTSAVP